jgi:hypothetical protein
VMLLITAWQVGLRVNTHFQRTAPTVL